jgi:hypothetical protein
MQLRSYKLLSWIVAHAGAILTTGTCLVVVFALLVSVFRPTAGAFPSFVNAVQLALTLLTAIESPAKLFPGSPFFIVFGWIVCMFGWIFFPLFIGAVVDNAVNRARHEQAFDNLLDDVIEAEGLDQADSDKLKQLVGRVRGKAFDRPKKDRADS